MLILFMEMAAAFLIGSAVTPGDFKALGYALLGVILTRIAVSQRTIMELQNETKKDSEAN